MQDNNEVVYEEYSFLIYYSKYCMLEFSFCVKLKEYKFF